MLICSVRPNIHKGTISTCGEVGIVMFLRRKFRTDSTTVGVGFVDLQAAQGIVVGHSADRNRVGARFTILGYSYSCCCNTINQSGGNNLRRTTFASGRG